MKLISFILALALSFLSGCGRSANNNTERALSSTSSSSGGKVNFNIISKSNTLIDREGNYKDYGHYSILYQAKIAKNNMPLSGLNRDEFYTMYENGVHIDESKLKVNQDSKIVSNKILLLLDFSGSIIDDCDKDGASSDPNNLCYQLVNSSKKFINKIVAKNQTMSIYYFNSQRKPMPLSNNAEPTTDKKLLSDSLDLLYDSSWREKNLRGYNSTNLYGAIKVAADEIVCDWFQDCIKGQSSDITDGDKKHYDFATIVTFTDGRHTVGNNVSLNDLLLDLALYKRNYYYTIGLGKDVDDKVLKQIGKDGYLKADQTQKLDSKFDNLGEELNSFANSFYRIDYCPAQQGGTLDLSIKMRDKQRKFYGTIEDKVDLINGIDFRCDL